MMVSSLLKKQLTAFLSSVSKHNSVAFCLTDALLQPVVSTENFHPESLARSAASGGRLLKTGSGNKEVSLRLFAEKAAGCPDTVMVEAVVDLAADGIGYFVKSEAEIQTLSEELLERYQELHVLYDVIEDVSTVFDKNEICRIILAKAVHSLNVGFGTVVLMDGTGLAIQARETDPKSTLAFSEDDCLSYARDIVSSRKHLILERTEQNNQSVLGVPIDVDNRAIGAIVLLAKTGGEMFTSGDRISLTALAGYLGVAVNTARLVAEAREAEGLRHEIEFAQQIQQSLLPDRVPEFARLDVAALCLPSAQVGGDLFGFIKLDSQQWALIVADVAGHGLGAAFIMASLRSILRSEAKPGVSAADILKNSNNLLNEDTRGNDVFATVFVGLYSEEDNSLRYSNAGHPPALLWKAATQEFLELAEGGVVLGLFSDETYEEKLTHLQTDDILVLFTDGIVESKSDDGLLYGDDRLRDVIKTNARSSSEELMKAILESVDRFRNGARQRDDVTILIFKSR
ncbi:MAG: SpoIIE family protein phosphatase [Ignavibacteriales bacterium]|nr:SpoIIE family protein phosphatase [Ignavibacteriales bacterium]